jgi:uncharacterized membrane protein YfcA
VTASQDTRTKKKPRYFERPDQSEKPLTLLETLGIILSSHLGVRTRAKREEDFRRANGLYVFICAILYFAAVITALIVLVQHISDN